jgi:uncharacterized protein YbjT (DUF2867 family)
MERTILVIGGTGMLGEPVARRLQADGYRVRILSRAPDKARARFGDSFEVVAGDVEDLASLGRALEGCQGVHVNLPGFPPLEVNGTANVARCAAQAGVSRLTYLSGASVCPKNAWFPLTRAKLEAEAAIRAAGVPYTIFQPTWFMESLRRFTDGRWAIVFGRAPLPFHWVAASDYARMVSRAYDTPAAADKQFPVFGPEAYTMREALTRYCAIAYPNLRVRTVPFWLAWMIAILGRQADLRAALPILRYCEKVGEEEDPAEANALLGAPTTTLEEWSRAQAARPSLVPCGRETGGVPGV